MESTILEEFRLEELNGLIQKFYGEIDQDEMDRMEGSYEECVTDMVEVSRVTVDGIELNSLYGEALFKPVHLPDSLNKLLRKEDVFMVTMGKDCNGWTVLFLSPVYEAVDWSEGDESANEYIQN